MKPLTPDTPHAIIMVGIPGAGKSSFAEHFASTFQAPIISQTKLQKEYQLDDVQAEALAHRFLDEVFKTRRTLLVDGGADRRTNRAELAQRIRKNGYQPLLVWVQTDTNEARRRATKPYPKGSGLVVEDFDAAVKQFQPPIAQEKPIVISGKHTYTTQLKVVLRQLAADSTPLRTPPSSALSSTPERSHARRVTVR